MGEDDVRCTSLLPALPEGSLEDMIANYEDRNAFVGRDLMKEAEEEKNEMNIYAEMISMEKTKSSKNVLGGIPTLLKRIAIPVKADVTSDDATDASTNPSISSENKLILSGQSEDGDSSDHTVSTESEVRKDQSHLKASSLVRKVREELKKLRMSSSKNEELKTIDDKVNSTASAYTSAEEVENVNEDETKFVLATVMDETTTGTEEHVSTTEEAEEVCINEEQENLDAEAAGIPIQKDDSKHQSTLSSMATFHQIQEDAIELSTGISESNGTAAASKAVQVSTALPHAQIAYSPASGVEMTEHESMPEISEDDVLIKVEATTISRRDCLERMRRDSNPNLFKDTFVPGHEIVGRVVRVGTKSRFLKNRRVAALLPAGGGIARYVRCNVANLISVPEHAASQDIVYLLSTYLSAYQCLEHVVESQKSCCVGLPEYLDADEVEEILGFRKGLLGKNIMITGAENSIGLALTDIARHAGANVYALTRDQKVKRNGINDRWYQLSQEDACTSAWKGKMDVIVDTIGDYDCYASFYDVLASSNGRFVRLNTTSSGKKYMPVQQYNEEFFSLFKDYKGIQINRAAIDYNIFESFEEDKKLFTEDLTYLFKLLQAGKIRRRVASPVGFTMVKEEWDKCMEGKRTGVVVVSCECTRFIC